MKIDPIVVQEKTFPEHFGIASGITLANMATIPFRKKSSNNNEDIFVTTDGWQSEQQITNFQQDYGVSSISKLTVSPDRHRIIFLADLGLPRTQGLNVGRQIFQISIDGKGLKHLRQFDQAPQGRILWSANSRYVAISEGEILLVDVQAGDTKLLTNDGTAKVLFAWR